MPFWKTDLTGRALVIPRAAWDDQHAASLECALPMDEGPSNRHGFVGAAQNTDVTVTAVPAPTLVTGQNTRFYGSCCSFTSSGLTVTFVDRSLFGAPNSNFTMETWVRVAETGDGALFTLGNVSVAIAGSTIVLCGDTSAAFTRAVWAHVAVVRNGSTTVTLFVNGVPVCTSSPTIAAAISTVAAFGVACLASDMRVYSTAKYAANFASSFVPTVVPASDITRTTNGTTVSIGITPSTYRTMRVYAGFADPADPAGPGTEVAFSERAAVYAAPSGITCTFASPVYTLTGTSVSVTTTGFTATAPGSVTIFASKTSGDPAPVAVSDRTALSATGTATVLCSFPTAGTVYVYARFANADGLFGGTLVAAPSTVTVTDYALPTVSATTTSPVPSQMVAGTPVQCTVTLTGSNYTSLTASSLRITIGTVAATGLSYVQSTGVATFTLTSQSGAYDVTLVISSPLAGSTFTKTTVVRMVLVDNVAGFAYPTAIAVSPASVLAGASNSLTVNITPALEQTVQSVLYYGATIDAAVAAGGKQVPLTAGTTGPVTFDLPSTLAATSYVFARIVTPSGVTGPTMQSAALALYVFPTSVASVSGPLYAYRQNVTIVLGGGASVPSTASVAFASTSTGTPTLIGSYTLNADGSVVFPFEPLATGTVFFFVKARAQGGQEQPSFLVSGANTVSNYEFPTVASSSVPSLVEATAATGSVTLTGPNVASFTAANMKITIGATTATGLTYNTTTGTVGFSVTPTRGVWPLVLELSAPSAISFSTTRAVGSFLVDGAAGFTYPTALTVSPILTMGVAVSATVTVTPAPGLSGAQCSVYMGATESLALATTAVTAPLSSAGSASVSLTAPADASEHVTVFIRVLTPSGVLGPVVRSAGAPAYRLPTAVRSVSAPAVSQGIATTVTVELAGASTLVGSTASVAYASTANSATPTAVGTFALTKTGTVVFPVTVATTGPVYFYVKARSPAGQDQAAFIVSSAVSVIAAVAVTDYTAFRAFASANTAPWRAFSSAFLAAYYKNMDGGVKFNAYYSEIHRMGGRMPKWASTMTRPTMTSDASSTPYATMSNLHAWWSGFSNDIRYGMRRMWWEFATPRVVTSIIMYGNVFGRATANIKDEVIASNDGINFVRIPTQWNNAGTEDTFHLRFDRRKKGGDYSFWLPATNRSLVSTQGLGTAPEPGKVCGASVGFGGATVEIELANMTAYKYYGIGSVGCGASMPIGSPYIGVYGRHVNARIPYGGTVSIPSPPDDGTWFPLLSYPADYFGESYPWTRLGAGAGGIAGISSELAMFAIPQVQATSGVPAPVTYKHWRIRAASSFWAACGPAAAIYLWKLGLYRDSATALADTFGVGSDNYVQQDSNELNVTGVVVPEGTESRDRIFRSILEWTDVTMLDYGNYLGHLYSLPSSKVYGLCVNLTSDAVYACVSLDVHGAIGAIRFPNNMYFDANVRGGALILEAATAEEPTKWVPMVCTTSGGAKLGREGLMAASSASSLGANAALTNTVFSVAPYANTYTPPTGVESVTVPGSNLQVGTKRQSCTVRVAGSVWTPSTNARDDFSVHLVAAGSGDVGPVKSDCEVTGYNTTTGVLTFDATPTTQGLCVFVVIVRSGEGTGITVAQLRPTDSYVLVEAAGTTDTLPKVATVRVPVLVENTPSQCSMILTGTGASTLVASSMRVTLGSAVATGLVYTAGTGTLAFTITGARGTWPLALEISSPVVTRSIGSFVVTEAAGFTFTAPATVYTLTGASLALAVKGSSAAGVTVFASKVASDDAPTPIASRVELSASGQATAVARFPSAGLWYVYARLSKADGVFVEPSAREGGTVTVVDYEMPTVASPGSLAFFAGVQSRYTLTLTGAGTSALAALTASNIGVTLGAAAATGVSYVPGSGSVGFAIEPPAKGSWPLSVTLGSPLTGSTFSVTRAVGTFAVDDPTALAFPASATLVSPQIMVQGHSVTVTLALSNPVQSAGTARVWYAATTSSTTPTLVGSYAVSATGTLSFPLSLSALGSVYFYVKSEYASGLGQAAYLITGAATVREYTFPTSFTVTSSASFIIEAADAYIIPCTEMVSLDEVRIAAVPSDTVAPATIAISYSTTQTPVGPGSQVWSLAADGTAAKKLRLTTGGTYYLFARVTAPSGAYRDIACATPVSTILSPLWPSTSTTTVNKGMILGRFVDFGVDYGPYASWQGDYAAFWDKIYDVPRSLPASYYSNCYSSSVSQLHYVLTNPGLSYSWGFGGATSAVWWFRWGYKMPLVIRRFMFFESAPQGSVFTITAFADSSFSSATIIATIPGSSIAAPAGETYTWVPIANPAPFTHYEIRQTVGPFVTGPTLRVLLSS